MIMMLVIMLGLIAVGLPIAFSIAASGLGYILWEGFPLAIMAQRMIVGIDSFSLLAIPLFIFAGAVMAEGEITPKIMALAKILVGRMYGGLALVMVVTCMFFGAISGSGVAAVLAVGGIMLPSMNKEGYKRPFSAALLGCSGCLATIIPPSITMVVLGVSMGTSIGRLFLGGFIPGILTGIALMVLAYFISRKEDYPRSGKPTKEEVIKALKEAILPMFTPMIIIVGIMKGIFTATEAGAVASLYAVILAAFVYGKLTWKKFWKVCYATGEGSAIILLIISAASLFGWIMASEQIPQRVADIILSISTNYWVVLLLFNLLLLFLGLFMETIAIVLIVTPIFMPIMVQLGMDLTHMGVMMVLNLAIGANTPPLGVSLITACRVAETPYESSFRYVFPFVGAMLIALIIVSVFPQVVTIVPDLLMGKAAP
jgi:tripartite ATP-independent transporter DctM subunit